MTPLPGDVAGADGSPPPGDPISTPATGMAALRAQIVGLIANGRTNPTARGAAWSLAISLFGMALSLGVQVVLARQLGPSSYGTYVYALAWMNIALLLGKLELDGAAVRYVAAYEATHAWGSLRGFLRMAGTILTGLSLGAAVVGVGMAFWRFPDPVVRNAVLASCILLPLTTIGQFRAAILQALRHVKEAQLPSLVVRPAVFALGLGIVWLAGRHASAADAVLLNAIGAAVALALLFWFSRRHIPKPVGTVAAEMHVREWLNTAIGLVLLSASQTILGTQTDVVVVGSLLTKADAAHYSTASQLAALVATGVTALMFVLMPNISSLHARRDVDGLQRLVYTSGRASLMLALPVALVLAVLGPWLLRIFGPSFVSGYPVLLILTASQAVIASLGTLAGFLMTMTGNHYPAGIIVAASALFNLATTFVLTRAFGPVGTAIATALATAVRTAALAVYLRRRVGITILPFGRPPRPR